jgi:hypothetical protein
VARRHPVAQDFLPDALIGGLDQRNFFVSEYGWAPFTPSFNEYAISANLRDLTAIE